MTPHQDNIETVRKVCVKANPTDDRWNVVLADEEKVRLADVLLAMGKKYEHSSANIGGFLRDLLNVGWNLSDDNLTKQSPETLEFLANLLKHE